MTLRYKRPDTKNAQSMIESAKRDMKFTLSLTLNDDSAGTIIRGIYECFRMLGDALLVAQGRISKEHTEQLKALLSLNPASPRSLQLLDNFRMLRHNINYYGYSPTNEEAEDILNFARQCFEPVCQAVENRVSQSL